MAVEYVIKNEQEAWDLLFQLEKGDVDGDEPFKLKFNGWPSLDLHYQGVDFDQSVPTRVMPVLLDAQKEIHRLYCQLRYGEQNLRKLTRDDRVRLELVVKVEKGSSNLVTNLQDALNEVVKNSLANMESKHILYAILGVALMWTSGAAWKAYVDSKAKEKEIESRVEMSRLEKEKIKLLTDIKSSYPSVEQMSGGIDSFRNHSLNTLKNSDKLELPNTTLNIDGNYASEITYTPRAESVEIRIDGDFIIQSVDSGSTKGFRLKVQRVTDNSVMTVNIPDGTLSAEQKEVLQKNEWAKKAVRLEINAKELRGQITSATLVKASPIEKKG